MGAGGGGARLRGKAPRRFPPAWLRWQEGFAREFWSAAAAAGGVPLEHIAVDKSPPRMPPHAASALGTLFEQSSIGDLRALRIERPRAARHAPRATPTRHAQRATWPEARPPPTAHRPPPGARRSFGERYVDNRRFAMLYAEALFTRFSDGGDSLNDAQAQQALQFLTPRPKDGGPKPAVHFAAPPGAYTASGELRLPKSWFMMLVRTMA